MLFGRQTRVKEDRQTDLHDEMREQTGHTTISPFSPEKAQQPATRPFIAEKAEDSII
jgi:hypothetical protein